MLKWILSKIPHITIPVDGSAYLTRYYLLGRDWPWFGIFLHFFHKSDVGPLHTHPWQWGWSLILKGGYQQIRCLAGKHRVPRWDTYYPGDTNTITKDIYHKVILNDEVNGCWTLFVVGKRNRDWTFLDPDTGEIMPRSINPGSVA